MRNRKALMHKMSSLFVILNGGIGTLDELVEVSNSNSVKTN